LKPSEQVENQPSVEGGIAYVVKTLLRDFGLFIVLPIVVLIAVAIVIPFPLSDVIFFSLWISWGLLIIIFSTKIFRHFDHLVSRTKRAISRMAPEYFGKDEERLFEIVYLRFLGPTFGLWMFRIMGAMIAGFFAYKLYIFLSG
jgi:hypothetical protein